MHCTGPAPIPKRHGSLIVASSITADVMVSDSYQSHGIRYSKIPDSGIGKIQFGPIPYISRLTPVDAVCARLSMLHISP